MNEYILNVIPSYKGWVAWDNQTKQKILKKGPTLPW